jgi:hypothetical protein
LVFQAIIKTNNSKEILMGTQMNQNGFGAVEGILIVFIVGIITGASWYVMKANKNIDKINTSIAKSSESIPSKNKTDPNTKKQDTVVYSTKTYTSPNGNFSFKYPDIWTATEPGIGTALVVVNSSDFGIKNTGDSYIKYGGQLGVENDSTFSSENIKKNEIYSNIKQTTINGKQAYIYFINQKEAHKGEELVSITDSKSTYTLSFDGPDSADYTKLHSIFLDFVQSFQFTK